MADQTNKTVSIPVSASGHGLKEEITKFAKARALTTSGVIQRVYSFAVNNPGSFPSELQDRRDSPGKHISTKVSPTVAEQLTDWARELGRTRASHCCFILEAFVADPSLQKKIFK